MTADCSHSYPGDFSKGPCPWCTQATAESKSYSAAVADVVKWLRNEPFRGLLLSDPIRKAAELLESGEWKDKVKP